MALTNAGFDGTVDESQYAYMWHDGSTDGVESSAAWLVTQGTGRQISVAAQAGWSLAKGVISKDTAAILVSVPTPTTGAWHLAVQRVNWSTNTVTVVLVAGATVGSTTAPTSAPTVYPTLNSTPGTLWDQPLAWVFVNSANTTLTIFDERKQRLETRLTQVETDSSKISASQLAPASGFTAGTQMNAVRTLLARARHSLTESWMVSLEGYCTGTLSTTSAVFTTLPVGYRPPVQRAFVVAGGGGAVNQILIETSGDISIRTASGSGSNRAYLDGITFRTSIPDL